MFSFKKVHLNFAFKHILNGNKIPSVDVVTWAKIQLTCLFVISRVPPEFSCVMQMSTNVSSASSSTLNYANTSTFMPDESVLLFNKIFSHLLQLNWSSLWPTRRQAETCTNYLSYKHLLYNRDITQFTRNFTMHSCSAINYKQRNITLESLAMYVNLLSYNLETPILVEKK